MLTSVLCMAQTNCVVIRLLKPYMYYFISELKIGILWDILWITIIAGHFWQEENKLIACSL